jgi:hypothetical protein
MTRFDFFGFLAEEVFHRKVGWPPLLMVESKILSRKIERNRLRALDFRLPLLRHQVVATEKINSRQINKYTMDALEFELISRHCSSVGPGGYKLEGVILFTGPVAQISACTLTLKKNLLKISNNSRIQARNM